jgi:hypothetical protein
MAGLLAAAVLAAAAPATPAAAQNVFETLPPATPAAAQNVFETLFGGFRRSVSRPQIGTPSDLFRSVFQDDRRARHGAVRSGGIGPRTAYCVRLCDGRYFPLQPQRNASAAVQCNAFCPASETRIFSGSGIEHAVAANGRRYADLPNAFLYRKRLVAGCTCSGRSTTGVAAVPVDDDTTLRPGDIVADNSGLTVYRGKDRQQQSMFTPVDTANISQRLREQPAGMKVTPQLPPARPSRQSPSPRWPVRSRRSPAPTRCSSARERSDFGQRSERSRHLRTTACPRVRVSGEPFAGGDVNSPQSGRKDLI